MLELKEACTDICQLQTPRDCDKMRRWEAVETIRLSIEHLPRCTIRTQIGTSNYGMRTKLKRKGDNRTSETTEEAL